jgi:hypothetical protein
MAAGRSGGPGPPRPDQKPATRRWRRFLGRSLRSLSPLARATGDPLPTKQRVVSASSSLSVGVSTRGPRRTGDAACAVKPAGVMCDSSCVIFLGGRALEAGMATSSVVSVADSVTGRRTSGQHVQAEVAAVFDPFVVLLGDRSLWRDCDAATLRRMEREHEHRIEELTGPADEDRSAILAAGGGRRGHGVYGIRPTGVRRNGYPASQLSSVARRPSSGMPAARSQSHPRIAVHPGRAARPHGSAASSDMIPPRASDLMKHRGEAVSEGGHATYAHGCRLSRPSGVISRRRRRGGRCARPGPGRGHRESSR